MPSAVLALLLEAFFLSEDGKPLRAVYGDADLSGHREWVGILKAGGDAGQLGKTFTLAVNLTALAGHGLASGARRIAAATSPWLLVAAGLGAAWWYLNRPASTRQRVASIAKSVLNCALGAVIAYQEVQDQFTSAAPKTPGWASLAADLPPARGPRARLPAHAGPQPRLRPLRRRADRGTALPGRRAGRGQGPPGPPRRRPVHRGLARQVAGRARRPGAAALPRHASRRGGSRLTLPGMPAARIRRTIMTEARPGPGEGPLSERRRIRSRARGSSRSSDCSACCLAESWPQMPQSRRRRWPTGFRALSRTCWNTSQAARIRLATVSPCRSSPR